MDYGKSLSLIAYHRLSLQMEPHFASFLAIDGATVLFHE
jgi:hypothetical protein